MAATGTFRALSIRSYRLFFFGQLISMSGTWMQSVAQGWLVLKLTGSGGALGIVLALQTLPVLFGGAVGGLIADRYDKRRLLLLTQSASGLLALALGIVTLTGVVNVWMVGLIALGLGAVNMIDIPARQSFIFEMVGVEHLTNAITLNSVVMNGGRIIGPAIAGVLIGTVGIAACFLVNSISYLGVIAGLALIRPGELVRGRPVRSAPGQLVEGLKYAWTTPALRVPLVMMALVGTFAYEFSVSLPLLARFTFHSGAQVYGLMTASMAIGAVIGGLIVARRARTGGRRLAIASAAFGTVILMTSVAPNLALVYLALAGTGAASIYFAAMANTSLQLATDTQHRGRVMSLYAIAFMGTTPMGGPMVGYIGQLFDPRAALAVGGLSAVVAAAYGWHALRPRRPDRVSEFAAPSGAGAPGSSGSRWGPPSSLPPRRA
jgi:MFS family permease